ncbi:hypothetical protein [Bifidobacterium sp. ESL0764]|uniref:hypothetical protein n=1 Tax=Bifidobacterium sp. ESL0764 TaxID=2983228 RepID=UPI0023F8C456|nr:hypothetical protein [Bifidobacterium sp. ESL0764]WEV65615.1 hypothetical protein OZX71_07675 [Bifidobacterium sp. ESL0764]
MDRNESDGAVDVGRGFGRGFDIGWAAGTLAVMAVLTALGCWAAVSFLDGISTDAGLAWWLDRITPWGVGLLFVASVGLPCPLMGGTVAAALDLVRALAEPADTGHGDDPAPLPPDPIRRPFTD